MIHVQELKELISSYQTLRESGRGPAICNTIIETARQCNLDKDIKLPEEDAKELDLAQRDGVVGQAYSRYVYYMYTQITHIRSTRLPYLAELGNQEKLWIMHVFGLLCP